MFYIRQGRYIGRLLGQSYDCVNVFSITMKIWAKSTVTKPFQLEKGVYFRDVLHYTWNICQKLKGCQFASPAGSTNLSVRPRFIWVSLQVRISNVEKYICIYIYIYIYLKTVLCSLYIYIGYLYCQSQYHKPWVSHSSSSAIRTFGITKSIKCQQNVSYALLVCSYQYT